MTKPRDAHNSAKTGRRTVNKKPDMPDSVDEAKKVLTVLAEHLRELPNKGRSLTFAEHAISSDSRPKTQDFRPRVRLEAKSAAESEPITTWLERYGP